MPLIFKSETTMHYGLDFGKKWCFREQDLLINQY